VDTKSGFLLLELTINKKIMRTKLSNEEVALLKQNPCVFSCSDNSINYTYEFKKRALELHKEGVFGKEIWRRSGFPVTKWRNGYFRETLRDWKKIVSKYGIVQNF